MPTLRTPTLALLAASAACAADAPSSALLPPAVRDSAGVRVVENRIPALGIPDYGRVGDGPELEIPRSGPEGALAAVLGALTLSDGRVVVADAGRRQLRYYAPDGTLLRATGEEGEGFDAFREVSRFGRAGGDSVWVYDVRSLRLTVLDEDGVPVLDARAPEGALVAGRFGDGSYLLRPGWRTSIHAERPVEGVRRDPATYRRWWPATGDTAAVGSFLHDELLVVEPEPGRQVVGTPPFGRRTSIAVGPGRFYVGEQTAFEVRGHDPDGTLREVVRLGGVDLAVGRADVELAREATRPGPGDPPEEPWVERFWEAVASTRPAYGDLVLDAHGHLWIGEHVATLAPPRHWMVFAPDGSLRGIVEVPPNFRLFEVGAAHVLGGKPAPGGGELVRRYPFARARAAGRG